MASKANSDWSLNRPRSACIALTAQIGETRQNLEEKRAAETTGKRHLDSLRGEYASAMGKKGSLEAVITEHGYTTESVRKLFTSGAMKEGLAPVGVLADFLEVEDRYEHVVDDFLRDELNYIVVKSWDAADEGLRLLRSDVDGRATFLVHPEDSQAKFSFLFDESTHQVAHGDSVVPLKHCIRVLNGFGKSLEVILPKLGNGYIVPDASAGRDLALENPDAFFLSKSGECFHNVTVTGGKQRSQGPLSMKRELREVLQQMGEMERAMADEEMRVAALGREIFELTGLLHRLEDDKREGERQAMTSGHTLRQLETEMVRVRERLSTYERELARVGRGTQPAGRRSSPNKAASCRRRKNNGVSLSWKCRPRRAVWKACACVATKPPSSPAKFGRSWRRWKNAAAERSPRYSASRRWCRRSRRIWRS